MAVGSGWPSVSGTIRNPLIWTLSDCMKDIKEAMPDPEWSQEGCSIVYTTSHVSYVDEGLRGKWPEPCRQWRTWQALSKEESTQFVSIASDRRLEMSRGVAALSSVSGFSHSRLEPWMAMLGAADCALPPLNGRGENEPLGLRMSRRCVSLPWISGVWHASMGPLAIFISKYTLKNFCLISFYFWAPLPFPAL